jgi:hypothetical protein
MGRPGALAALAAGLALAAPDAHAASPERQATAEDCAIIALVARSEFQNPRGIIPLRLRPHLPAQDGGSPALRDIQGSATRQYYRDYFPQLPAAEADDLSAAAARRQGGFALSCDWSGLGLAFAGTTSVLELEEPVVSSDDRYAIETSRYSTEGEGTGGSDCLLENRAGRWVKDVCRPTGGRP